VRAQLEKIRTDAAECALIRDLATEPRKRELFNRLAENLTGGRNREAALGFGNARAYRHLTSRRVPALCCGSN